jgi:hypothetical protein
MNWNGASLKDVAQIFNLLYRRFLICRRYERMRFADSGASHPLGRPADSKSAIQQIENLRYHPFA